MSNAERHFQEAAGFSASEKICISNISCLKQCCDDASYVLLPLYSFWGWGVGAKEINTSPRAPLVKSEPLMHYCLVPEAKALTTTLSVRWTCVCVCVRRDVKVEAAAGRTVRVIAMAFSLDGVIQLSVK